MGISDAMRGLWIFDYISLTIQNLKSKIFPPVTSHQSPVNNHPFFTFN
ncbi:MAG: hypothetical protein ACKPBB_12950 [Sphaerospermopsis kisseleviana]